MRLYLYQSILQEKIHKVRTLCEVKEVFKESNVQLSIELRTNGCNHLYWEVNRETIMGSLNVKALIHLTDGVKECYQSVPLFFQASDPANEREFERLLVDGIKKATYIFLSG